MKRKHRLLKRERAARDRAVIEDHFRRELERAKVVPEARVLAAMALQVILLNKQTKRKESK